MTSTSTTAERAFVAGATGYTGRQVVRVLRELDVAVSAHVRPDSGRMQAWRDRFASLGAATDATPWDEAAMTSTLRELRPTIVFALLGTTRRRGKEAATAGRTETYETVDYGLTSLLLRATLASGARPRFVYLSAVGVSDATTNPYLAARAKMEAELRRSGLPYTIARPSFITGEDREESRPLERGAAALGDLVLGVAARLGARQLASRYASMDGATLAQGLVHAALDRSCENAVLETAQLRAAAQRVRNDPARRSGVRASR